MTVEKIKELSRRLLEEDDSRLSPFATPNSKAIRRRELKDRDFRGEFAGRQATEIVSTNADTNG